MDRQVEHDVRGRNGEGRVRRVRWLLPTAAAVWLLGGLVPTARRVPEQDHGPAVRAEIRRIVEGSERPDPQEDLSPLLQSHLRALYAPTGCAPLWLRSAQPDPAAREAIAVLFEGAEVGLDPERYGATELLELHDRLAARASAAPASETGRFETGLSLALLRHVSDRHIGLVDPRTLGVELDLIHKQVDAAAIVRQAAETGKIRTVAGQADSRLAQYRHLRDTLGAYRRLAAEAGLQPLPPATKVKVGMPYAGAGDLHRLLSALGDIPAGPAAAEGEAAIYTEALAEGVRSFQRRHGLWVDGVLGTTTLTEINTPLASRARQLELALERLRWLPDLEDGPVVIVNIPAFRAWTWTVAAGDLAPALAMNVVVGRAVRHETPLFTKEMRYLVFNPFWLVPFELSRREIVPELSKDPGYLARENMELVRDFAQVGPTVTEVTPQVIEEVRRGTLKVRQRPGPGNSLGRVKFVFPNDQEIFMHDTPAKSLFRLTRRDLSHGCIRVQEPAALAAFVLAHNRGWDRKRVDEVMRQGETLQVDLAVTVPVYILYSTAYPEPDGTVHFLRDIYGHDRRLEAALAAVDAGSYHLRTRPVSR